MYLNYWGLASEPFAERVDAGRIVAVEAFREARARLDFALAHRFRVAVMCGPAGCGKTLALADLAARQQRRGARVALLPAELLALDDLGWQLAEAWHLGPEAVSAPRVTWRRIRDFLAECQHEQRQALLLIDDAEQLAASTWSDLTRLMALDRGGEGSITLVLAGRGDGLERHAASTGACPLRVDLEPLSTEEVGSYLERRLGMAGSQRQVFATEAVARIAAISGRVPRRISALAELCLVVGAAAEVDQIDRPLVDSVYDELAPRSLRLPPETVESESALLEVS